jgi:hypothetical protein
MDNYKFGDQLWNNYRALLATVYPDNFGARFRVPLSWQLFTVVIAAIKPERTSE